MWNQCIVTGCLTDDDEMQRGEVIMRQCNHECIYKGTRHLAQPSCGHNRGNSKRYIFHMESTWEYSCRGNKFQPVNTYFLFVWARWLTAKCVQSQATGLLILNYTIAIQSMCVFVLIPIVCYNKNLHWFKYLLNTGWANSWLGFPVILFL